MTEETMMWIQSISTLLAIVVAVSSLKIRLDERAGLLAKMRTDIEHIKKTVDSVAPMRDELVEAKASIREAHRRLDEHMKYEYREKEKDKEV